MRLNAPYRGGFPLDLPAFNGNYGDLVILVAHRLITDGQAKIASLCDCLMTIIANVSPYVKSFGMQSSNKLLNLFQSFTAPAQLLSNDSVLNIVGFLLETFNNCIQYQFDGNARLVYGVIRRKELFHELRDLTYAAAVAKMTIRKSSPPPAAESEAATATAAAVAGSTSEKTKSADTGAEASTPTSPSAAVPSSESLTAIARPSTDGAAAAAVPQPAAGVDLTKPRARTAAVTEDRFNLWKEKLPLQTVVRLLQVLVPQIDKMCVEKYDFM